MLLLVTTRGAGRWVIPKGWAEPQLQPHELAEREAFEEAGVLGAALATPIGAYRYRKRMPSGRRATCLVEVFPLEVEGLAAAWPEQGQRESRWFTPEQAADSVAQPGLARLLRSYAAELLGEAVAGEFVGECPSDTVPQDEAPRYQRAFFRNGA